MKIAILMRRVNSKIYAEKQLAFVSISYLVLPIFGKGEKCKQSLHFGCYCFYKRRVIKGLTKSVNLVYTVNLVYKGMMANKFKRAMLRRINEKLTKKFVSVELWAE